MARDTTADNKVIVLDLHCDITGVKLGEAVLETRLGWDEAITEAEYKQLAGIIDMRSPEAEAEHGTYKKMAEEYEQRAAGNTTVSAEEFISVNRTRESFDGALDGII